MKRLLIRLVLTVCALPFALPALADPAGPGMDAMASADPADSAPSQTPTLAAAAPAPIGLNVDVEMSSVYVFRGINVFKASSQSDQTGLFAPSITYTMANGFHVGYWGAYQIAGSNRAALVDAGSGNEQDVIVGWSHDLIPGKLNIDATLTWYLYPFATKAATGTTLPSYLEPSVGITWSGPVDLGLRVAYFAGVQSALSDFRYLYIRPTLGKSFTFNKYVGLGLAAGFGYKVFNNFSKMTDNVYDVRFDWTIPIHLTDTFYVTPAAHFAWTNLSNASVGDQYVVWGGVDVGVNL